MILEIEALRGQPMHWFESLPLEDQTRLFAWYNVRTASANPKKPKGRQLPRRPRGG